MLNLQEVYLINDKAMQSIPASDLTLEVSVAWYILGNMGAPLIVGSNGESGRPCVVSKSPLDTVVGGMGGRADPQGNRSPVISEPRTPMVGSWIRRRRLTIDGVEIGGVVNGATKIPTL